MTVALVALALAAGSGWSLAVALIVSRGIAIADRIDGPQVWDGQTWMETETIKKSGRRGRPRWLG